MPEFILNFFRKLHGYFLPTKHNAFRPHLLQTSWLLFFLALILTAEGVLLTNVIAGQSARDFLAAVLPAQVVELTNLERGFTNTTPLKQNALLTQAAEAKAKDMASKSYFAHVGPDGKQPWQWLTEAGYKYGAAGENLAVRFNESKDVVEAWMASPKHRANIIKPTYKEIGVGVAQGIYKGSPATFVVQYFGRPIATASGAQVETSSVAAQGADVLGAAAELRAKQDAATMVASVGLAPSAQAFALLAGAAGFMILLVFLTVVVSPQVQPVDLVLGGGGVAAVAVALLILNFTYVGPALSTGQTAAAVTADNALLIGEGAEIEVETEAGSVKPQGDSELAS